MIDLLAVVCCDLGTDDEAGVLSEHKHGNSLLLLNLLPKL